MQKFAFSIGACLVLIACTKSPSLHVEQWATTADKTYALKNVETRIASQAQIDFKINVDTSNQYQSMEGFGFSLTGGSAMLLSTKFNKAQRNNLWQELFLENGININYLRISIGASDLDEKVFSYCDFPVEISDPLKKFSLAYDTLYLVPILKEILNVNPEVKIMGSPWSAPPWMKDNNLPKGGKLLERFYPLYASYFVRYIQAMAQEGVVLDAITIQNEPENPNNTPSMIMSAAEQAAFIRDHLGPAFIRDNIKTKIVTFDHNCDHPQFPIEILNDKMARSFVDGTAFHLYLGQPDAMSTVHESHPDKNIYFTEQWTSGHGKFEDDLFWHIQNVIIGATRNWSKVVLEWNLANDAQFGPHTSDGGCTECQGAITISDSLTRNVSYYIIAHASKFIPRGSVRIEATFQKDLPAVAFLTPDKKVVVIVLNVSTQSRVIEFEMLNEQLQMDLTPRTVSTLVFSKV